MNKTMLAHLVLVLRILNGLASIRQHWQLQANRRQWFPLACCSSYRCMGVTEAVDLIHLWTQLSSESEFLHEHWNLFLSGSLSHSIALCMKEKTMDLCQIKNISEDYYQSKVIFPLFFQHTCLLMQTIYNAVPTG